MPERLWPAARARRQRNSRRLKRLASRRCARPRKWVPPSQSGSNEGKDLSHPAQLRCVMAQLNLVVGDVDGNTSRIVAAANEARDRYRADIVMLPELAVSGYPPEDLLFHSGMRLQVARSLERLKQEARGITLIAGYPEYAGSKIFNAAIVIRDGKVLANHRKACLPNYRVFDEKRYFTPGTEPTLVELNGVKAGVLVCEDVWDAEPP